MPKNSIDFKIFFQFLFLFKCRPLHVIVDEQILNHRFFSCDLKRLTIERNLEYRLDSIADRVRSAIGDRIHRRLSGRKWFGWNYRLCTSPIDGESFAILLLCLLSLFSSVRSTVPTLTCPV